MPNHCSQDLYVYGDEQSIKDFIEFSKDSAGILSADKYIPYPQKYKDMDQAAKVARENGQHIADGFNSGGYEWCLDNWGTKWGIYNAKLTKEKFSGSKSQVNYTFESAWSPATLIIKAMAEKYPSLRFKLKYYEMGAGFKGTYEIKGDNVLVHDATKYSGSRGG